MCLQKIGTCFKKWLKLDQEVLQSSCELGSCLGEYHVGASTSLSQENVVLAVKPLHTSRTNSWVKVQEGPCCRWCCCRKSRVLVLVAVGPCVSGSSVWKCVLRDALPPQHACCARVLLFLSAATRCRSTLHVCVFEAHPGRAGTRLRVCIGFMLRSHMCVSWMLLSLLCLT